MEGSSAARPGSASADLTRDGRVRSYSMAHTSAYRSFTIYLILILIISESPVSAFSIRRMRTTTLRPLLDLTGEESALLEVKSDLSKLNHERDNLKYGREKVTTRKSDNFLSSDKKLVSISRKTLIPATTATSLNKSTEQSTPLTTSNERSIQKDATNTEIQTTKTNTNAIILAQEENETNKPTTDYSITKRIHKDLSQKPDQKVYIDRLENIYITTENFASTPLITEIKTTGNEILTSEIYTEPSSDVLLSTSYNRYSKETTNTETNKVESTTPEMVQVELTSPQVDITTFNDKPSVSTEADHAATYSTKLVESMSSQPSKASTKNPFWKKYTVIERKRIIPTTRPTHSSSEKSEELEKAESVSSRITLENAVDVTPIDSLEELRQELISYSKTSATKSTDNDRPTSFLTTQSDVNTAEGDNKQTLTTASIENATHSSTTEGKTDFVASKRAGYLDYSAKQQTQASTIISSTERLDYQTEFNETDLIGSMFETETQEDGPDVKNSTLSESQSQLADDAIKEELLKEQVLNDHVEHAKRNDDQQELNKVKPLKGMIDTDESLSVKPIHKGSLYTVSSNYKKMKKLEVQPSKPFVRDPDDNSWRNESLSSLGIVFKAKNASKPFTQVLKNKTEAELNNVVQPERDNTNEVPDLRQRLEKIAEVRKSKKKKIDKFGDTVYSDYEETSGETSSTPKTDTVSLPALKVGGETAATAPASPATEAPHRATTPEVYMYKEETVTTKKPKKTHKFSEYYDTTDEYDIDYINLSKIDLKKFTTRLFAQDKMTTSSPVLNHFTKPMTSILPERRPTVQYFPPRQSTMVKVNVNDYDSEFRSKVDMYAQDKTPKDAAPVTYATLPPATMIQENPVQYHKQNAVTPPEPEHQYQPGNLDKNIYVTFPPRVADHDNKHPGSNDESFNRASYVIKHYKDLINAALKADYDKDFMPAFTEPPLTGVTMTKEKDPMKQMEDDYDYDANVRKDIINHFMENFNQNSERFKVDFPILYNNSVVHMGGQDGGKAVASSSAFMTRLHGAASPACAQCDVRVELAPAYELHYYVPDQEERQEAELKPAALPYTYRL